MGRLLAFIVVLAIIVGIIGFYRGWFAFSSTSNETSSGFTVTVDKTKVQEDKAMAEEKAQAVGEQVKSKVSTPTTAPADPR